MKEKIAYLKSNDQNEQKKMFRSLTFCLVVRKIYRDTHASV